MACLDLCQTPVNWYYRRMESKISLSHPLFRTVTMSLILAISLEAPSALMYTADILAPGTEELFIYAEQMKRDSHRNSGFERGCYPEAAFPDQVSTDLRPAIVSTTSGARPHHCTQSTLDCTDFDCSPLAPRKGTDLLRRRSEVSSFATLQFRCMFSLTLPYRHLY